MSHAAVEVRSKTDLAKTQGEQPRWLWRLVGQNAEVERLGDERRALHDEITRRKIFFSLGLLAPPNSDARDRERAVRVTPPANFNASRWNTSFIFLFG